MNNVSINRILEVWDQLWLARCGEHSYGSDTAEIYAYLLMSNDPLELMESKIPDSELVLSAQKERYSKAATSLYNIVTKFAEMNDVKCLIDKQNPEVWLAGNPYFPHRVHVKVLKETK